MDVRLLFPNQYIAAPDLHGKPVTLTIARVVKEKLRTEKGEEVKPLIYFTEMEERHKRDPEKENKRLVLNKTNARAIAEQYGNETDDWIGKKITIYPTTCTAFGRTVDCIRIKTDREQLLGHGRYRKSDIEKWKADPPEREPGQEG